MTDTAQVQDREVIAAHDKSAKLLLRLWARTRMDWGYVTDSLAGAFRKNRGLGSSDRRFISETLYGMVRHWRRLDEALALGGVRFTNRAPDAERLVAYLMLEEGLSVDGASSLSPGVDWEVVSSINEKIETESNQKVRLARLYSFPDWLTAMMVKQYENAAGPLLESLNKRAPLTIRANVLARERDAVAETLEKEGMSIEVGSHGPWSLHVSSRGNVFSSPSFKNGLFEVQDEGSQLIAELVAPPPGGLIVDYCAGAGGKTLAIAALLKNRGRIVACGVDAKKLTELRRRSTRAGVTNTRAVLLEREEENLAVLAEWQGKASRVLVDSPCTGVGAIRRNPEARWRLAKEDISRMATLQFSILDQASTLVAPGGRLVYATCSLLKEENQDIVEKFLKTHSEYAVMTVKEIWGAKRSTGVSSDGRFLELSPSVQGTDGFFAAVLRRSPQG